MKFLSLITFVLMFLVAFNSNAAYKRYELNPKWPTDKSIHMQTITNPAAAGTADVLSANAGNSSAAAASVSSFVAQPDVPRNLVITPGGTTADVAACDVVVTGTDFFGASLSETFSFSANASTATTGTKAFKTVSSVSFPADCEDSPYGATWSIGYGEKLGLNRCMDNAGDILFSLLNGAKEGTAPTMAKNVSAVSGNTADFNGTMNGSNDFVLYFFHNYRCNP